MHNALSIFLFVKHFEIHISLFFYFTIMFYFLLICRITSRILSLNTSCGIIQTFLGRFGPQKYQTAGFKAHCVQTKAR